MKSVMADTETLGLNPDSVILSIGAVAFDPLKPDYREEFYVAIKLSSYVEPIQRPFSIDYNTLQWWLQQSPEAQKVLTDPNALSVEQALVEYASWATRIQPIGVWALGSDFDNALLNRAYRVMGLKYPYSYKHHRCARTLFNMFPCADPPFQGTAHNALADAKWQTDKVFAIIEKYPHLRGHFQ